MNQQRLSDDELLAYYEKLATLALTMNHLLNTIPDNAFQKQMKQMFGNTLNHSNIFCRKLRREVYDTVSNKSLDIDLTRKSDFIIPMLDIILNLASTINPLAYAAFKNEMTLVGNRIIYHYTKDDPDAKMVTTKEIEITK